MSESPSPRGYTHANGLAIRATHAISLSGIDAALAHCENIRMQTLTVRDLRLRNLQVIVKQSGGQAALARQLKVGPSFISQMLNGHRGIGDSIARRIERVGRKPSGWLDNPQQEAWGELLMAQAAGRPVFTDDTKNAKRAWIEAELSFAGDNTLDLIVHLLSAIKRPPSPEATEKT